MSNLFATFGSIHRSAGSLRSSTILSIGCIGLSGVLAAPAAVAQTAPVETATGDQVPSEQAAGETIVVTGTRVSRPGFVSPTPVTSINEADLARVGATNVADALNQLPALKPSVTPGSVGNLSKLAGGNYLDLRGLGYLRTLTLIDGERYVPTTPEGVININLVPQALIGSVDVVTGGASAAYGSDAVSGVVNIRLDHKLEGFKGSLQSGISDHQDHKNYLLSLGYGHNFDNGRGHLLIGFDSANNRGIKDATRRDWAGNRSLIVNPASATDPNAPFLIHVDDARAAFASPGGLILTGVLRGTKFDPGGTTSPFVYGSDLTDDNTMNGGDGDPLASPYVLETPVKRQSGYAGVDYDFSDKLTGYANFDYARTKINERSIPSDDVFVIQADNAFLPTAVRSALATAGETAFLFGRGSEDYGVGRILQRAHTWQATAGLKGTIGGSWTFDTSYALGKTRTLTDFTGDVIKARRLLAIDAVVDPATGGIVCRSTLTNPGNGCVPLNLFGAGAPSAASIDYITGTSVRDWRQKQQIGDLVIRGTPFHTWAGPVSLAIGAEWRRLDVDVSSDPISATPNQSLFRVGNTKPYSAHEIVREGFAEAVVPLASGESWAKNIDLDVAGRITHYRTSGTVGTWKVGLNYAINDWVRIRATRSRDIRAPNINELSAAGQTLLFTITDPLTNSTYTVSQTTGGNPFLQPEKADTWTAGAVFTPQAIRGLSISVDYYNIKVNGAIASLTSQTIVNRCAAGDSASCQLITRDSTGHITNILLAPVNFQTLKTDGVDVEVAYRTRAFGGSIDWHALVNYLHRLDLTNVDGSVTRFAGNTDQPVLDGPGGTPHLKVNSSVTFQNDLFQASLTGRYVGGGVITRDDVTLDYNHVKGQFYFDLSAEVSVWKLDGGGRIALFGVIQNLLDNDPPFTGYEFQTARQLYDVIGRQYTLGVRARF
jgi:outer membrane receptor protein involved in Fe transport